MLKTDVATKDIFFNNYKNIFCLVYLNKAKPIVFMGSNVRKK